MGAIIAANSREEKLALLLELREKLEGLQVLLRICKEVRAFDAFGAASGSSVSFCLNYIVRHVLQFAR